MMNAHEALFESEVAVDARRASRTAGTAEKGRRVCRDTRLSSKEMNGKAAKALAQCAALDPASPAINTKLRELHTMPVDPISIIPEINLQSKPKISPVRSHAYIKEMHRDSATGPDREGVRWLLLVASNGLLQGAGFFRAEAPSLCCR